MYTKTNWVARVGTALNRFLKTNETSTEVELTNDPTGVTTAGTPFTVANMNKIEDGIYDNSVELDTIKDGGTLQGLSEESIPSFAGLKILDKSIKFTPTATILSNFSTPAGSMASLTFDWTTGNLISCDNITKLIYIHDGISSTILSSFESPNLSPFGVAFDGDNLISCGLSPNLIYIHDGVSSTILSSFACPSTSISDIAFDGTNLISCDTSTHMIYKHSGISATISSSFASPGIIPSGIAFDGVNLISCDGNSTTGLIYIHNGISATILSSFESPALYIRGLAFDLVHLISSNTNTDKIYTHASSIYI